MTENKAGRKPVKSYGFEDKQLKKYTKRRNMYLIGRYGSHAFTWNKTFPEPEDFVVAVDRYTTEQKKKGGYISPTGLAARVGIMPRHLFKYKEREGYEDAYNYLEELQVENLIEQGLYKNFDSKIVKLILSNKGLVEKTSKEINVLNNGLPVSMVINAPKLEQENVIDGYMLDEEESLDDDEDNDE